MGAKHVLNPAQRRLNPHFIYDTAFQAPVLHALAAGIPLQNMANDYPALDLAVSHAPPRVHGLSQAEKRKAVQNALRYGRGRGRGRGRLNVDVGVGVGVGVGVNPSVSSFASFLSSSALLFLAPMR